MSIISWIILGLIAGFVGAKLLIGRVKVFGSILRLELSALLSVDFCLLCWASGVTGLNIYSMIVAIVGAVVVLLIYNAVTGRRRV